MPRGDKVVFGTIPDVDQNDPQWHWKIRAYRGSKLQLETVHTSVNSRDIELEVIRDAGMTAKVYKRGPRGGWKHLTSVKRRKA